MSASANTSPDKPALPPRLSDPLGEIPGQNAQVLPDFSGSVSHISLVKQHESYSSPQMNEASDLFVINGASHETLQAKLEAVLTENPDIHNQQFWSQIIDNYNSFVVSRKTEELEEKVVEGIPQQLRGLVYSKVFQVRYKFNNKESYQNLVKRAKSSSSSRNSESYIERLDIDANLKEVLKTFNFYINEVAATGSKIGIEGISSNGSAATDSEKLPPNSFVIHVSKLLENLQGLDAQETFFLLLKFNKLFSNLIKGEFYYKINRSLEDIVPTAFNHISVQGINFHTLYKSILFNFFDTKIKDPEVLLKILDFLVFEGFDFVLRLIVWVFYQNKDKITELNGDELNEFVNSPALFELDFDWFQILNQQPQPEIIKYENEYHLIHANSLNNNGNELINLKEVSDELEIKIGVINHQLDNLQTTHTEILEQSQTFMIQLNQALQKNEELNDVKDQLQSKYETLTMKENLKNTIKANKEFSKRNDELQQQIDALKKTVEEKTAKLSKVAA